MMLQYLLVFHILLNRWTTSQTVTPDCNLANSSFSCTDDETKQQYEKCFTTKFCTTKNNFEPKTLPECPQGFVDASDFCYVITEKSPFPPKCPFANVISWPFQEYQDIVTRDKVGPVWMPVHRNLTNGLGFLQWVEHTDNYKTEFQGFYTYDGELKGKDCLLYNNSTVVAVSCKEEHLGICAYAKMHNAKNVVCGGDENCVKITQRADPKCVCAKVSLNLEDYRRAEFLDPSENVIHGLVASKKNCTIGLSKTTNGVFVWTNTGKEIDYTFWSPSAVFDDDSRYVASTGNGWILTKESASCTLIEKNVTRYDSNLYLHFADGLLTLNFTFPPGVQLESSLVVCFTDANSTTLLYRYPNMQATSIYNISQTYQFEPFKNVPGHYWCEVLTYSDPEIVTSNVIFLEASSDYPEQFVATYRLVYTEGMNPLSFYIGNMMEFFADGSNCLYQLIKILDLDETQRQVLVKIRYSCPKQTSPITPNVKRISFQKVDFCPSVVEGNVTWQETRAGTTANAQEFCFTPEGYNFERSCLEDDFSGAYWIEKRCSVPKMSSITKHLLEITLSTTRNRNEVLSELENASRDYFQFNAYDVFIVANFTNMYLNDEEFFVLQCADTMDTIIDIVNNILKIERQIILESQHKMHAVDVWVDIMYKMQNICLNRNIPYYYTKTNMDFVVSTTTAWCRTTPKDGTKGKILLDITALDDILNNKDIESAIWIDPGFNYTTTYLKYYSKEGFFFDESVSGNVSSVYELDIGDEYEIPVWLIQRFDNTYTRTRKIKCAYWQHGEITGSWIVDSELVITNTHFICNFKNLGIYTMILTPESNARDSLTEILVSNSSSSEILSRLAQVTSKSDGVVSTDVFLIGQILKKVSVNEDVDLDILGDTINNLHNFDRSVLETSQNEGSATDSILYNVDAILQNYECPGQCLVKKDNFVSMIYNKEEPFGAFVLLGNGEVEIVTDIVTLSDLSKYENLDSAVILSPELKTQLGNDSKLIVSIFHNDALFNEKKKTSHYHVLGKVYSVILPDILTNYSGPLSIVHKRKITKIEQECSYWSYNLTQNIAGFWKNYATSKTHPSLIQCDFWHTTHFGILILADTYEETPILDFITTTCCILSMFGYFSLILTAFLYKSWRTKGPNKFLLNFAFSGLFQTLVFYISTNKRYLANNSFCIFTGVVLHYSVLVQFCWMFIIAHLQYKKIILNSNEQTTHFLLKTNLMTWGLPLIVIISVLAAHGDNYSNSKVGICYPTGTALYLGVWWPISIVIANNFFIYVFIVDAILNTKDSLRRHGPDDSFHHLVRIGALFFFLGLTWIFGFLAEVSHSTIFIYLFDILATLQGFILFLIYVVFSKSVKELYLSKIRKPKKRHETDVLMGNY